MGRARQTLAALLGVAALGGASVATEDCGSVPADVDGAAHDASVDDAGDACGTTFSCVDAQPDGSSIETVACPDAGYYVTIDGDGVTQTLTSNVYYGVPVAYFIDCCGYQALGIVGSENPDGGAALRIEQACSKDPDGGLTLQSGPDYVAYFRSGGTTFSSYGDDASPTTVYTELGPPGSVVAGSYAVTVATSTQPDAATLSLSGTFFMCRVQDSICECPPPPGPDRSN